MVGGVLAASGFLVFSGAFHILTNHSLDFSVLEGLRNTPLIAVLPALGIALVLLMSQRIRSHFLGFPSVILLGTVGFYGLAASVGLTTEHLRALGLLLEPVSSVTLPTTFNIPFDLVAWQVIGSHVIELGAVVVVALTETALALSETLYGAESNTVEAGGTTRLLGVWTSGPCLTIVIVFPALISLLPKPVIAGLLFYLSLSMLLEWAIASRRRLPLYEYTLLLLILGATVLKGFLAGALLGLIAACILFAWNYGRVTCIKSAFTGQSYRSRVRRTFRDDKILAEHGESTFGLSYLKAGERQTIEVDAPIGSFYRISDLLNNTVCVVNLGPALDEHRQHVQVALIDRKLRIADKEVRPVKLETPTFHYNYEQGCTLPGGKIMFELENRTSERSSVWIILLPQDLHPPRLEFEAFLSGKRLLTDSVFRDWQEEGSCVLAMTFSRIPR